MGFLPPLGLYQAWPPSSSPRCCPIPSHEISCSWRRPGRFLPGKEGAGELGGADTPHQSQWLITGVRAQCHVHRFPGDPRDKGNIRDNLNHQEAPPFLLLPLLLPWRLAPRDSALCGHQALLADRGGKAPANSHGRVQGRGTGSMAALGQGCCLQEAFPGASIHTLISPPFLITLITPKAHLVSQGFEIFKRRSPVCSFPAEYLVLSTGPGIQLASNKYLGCVWCQTLGVPCFPENKT